MKKYLLLPLVGLCAFTMYGRHLTPDQALSRALGSTSAITAVASRSAALSLSYTTAAPDASEPGVYVFTRGNGNGYLVVSADDSTPALLGYSDSGTFEPSAMAPALKAWLEEYARQIAWAAENPSSFTLSPLQAPPAPAPGRPPIEPMMTTLWDQDAPFNNRCPLYDGEPTYTGCVATSMAQVMKYHNWPKKGSGSRTYTTSTTALPVSCDFSSITFDWDNMLDSYNSSATATQNDAVANLMFAAGASVYMDYSDESSGASPFYIAPALITNFGYAKTCAFHERSWYGLEEWNNLIYNSLDCDGPVILGGYNNETGHSFVCDGYSTDGYFHINWGWGGMSNGYFLLTALTPGAQGIGGSLDGYNFSQDAVTGIRKPKTGDTAPAILTAGSLSAKASSKNVTITGSFYNMSTIPLTTLRFGLEINGKYYDGGVVTTSLGSIRGYESYKYTVGLSTLAAGTYDAYPVYKCNETGAWKRMSIDISEVGHFVVTVSSSGSLTVSAPAREYAFKVTGFTIHTPMSPGTMYKATATVSNTAPQEYLGSVYLIAVNQSSEAFLITDYPVDILPSKSQEIDIETTLPEDLAEGDYTLYLAVPDIEGVANTISIGIPVNVAASPAPVLKINTWEIENATAATIDGIKVNANIANSGGYFYNNLSCYIYDTDWNYVYAFYTPGLFIPANSAGTDVSFTFAFPTGEEGKSYYMALYYDDWLTTRKTSKLFTIVPQTGIDEIDIEPGDSSIVVYNLAGTKVDYDTAPAGIYIKVTTSSTGHRTTTKIAKH